MQLQWSSGWLQFLLSCSAALILTYFLLRKRVQRPAPQPEAPKPAAKQKLSIHGTKLIKPSCIDTLTNLTVDFDVYLVFQVINDLGEQIIRDQLASVPIPSHHILFCETSRGLQACIRQLNARLHLESEMDLAVALKPIMNQIVMVTTEQCEGFLQIVQIEDSERFLSSVLAGEQ